MKNLLFVDHSYHEKTRATVFLQELLAVYFDVELIWDQRWNKGPSPSAADLNARNADVIVFFQTLPRLRGLRGLRCPNIVWVPMRDGLNYRSSRLRRLGASTLKTLNFCQEAHNFFSDNGHESMFTQYWPPAADIQPRASHQAPAIFFWPRRREITWQTLKTLLGDFRPRKIVLRYAPDPGHEFEPPSDADIRDYRITVLKGWLEHEQYLAQLRDCDIFMAPRPFEGIGQAMLEAMNYGMAVIAPDAPTMNEYVVNGRSGWLYTLAEPLPLDFAGWSTRGGQARSDLERGHEAWQRQAEEVAAFVAAAPGKPARWDWRLLQALGL